jgi:hypothetical protein
MFPEALRRVDYLHERFLASDVPPLPHAGACTNERFTGAVYKGRCAGSAALHTPLYITLSLMVIVPKPDALSMTYWKIEPLRLTENDI